MHFQVGRFTCELALDDGKLQARWSPDQPKYLSRPEREQYRAGVAAFPETLGDHDQGARRNVARQNGRG
jgi:hypothetical protein